MSPVDPILLGFIVAVVLIELTPGPNMTYLAILAASRGSGAALFAVAGVAAGLLIVGTLSAFGVAALVAQSTALWQFLRWAGVFYLLWLAWEAWQGADGEPGLDGSFADAPRTLFLRGVLTNLLNPKAFVFYIAVLPRFLVPGDARPLHRTLMLTLIYVAIATAIHAAIVLAAGEVQRLFEKGAAVRRLRKSLAILLAVVAVWLAWETR
jgi:threonine/homoserine/homoserine lactone efflux protein